MNTQEPRLPRTDGFTVTGQHPANQPITKQAQLEALASFDCEQCLGIATKKKLCRRLSCKERKNQYRVLRKLIKEGPPK